MEVSGQLHDPVALPRVLIS